MVPGLSDEELDVRLALVKIGWEALVVMVVVLCIGSAPVVKEEAGVTVEPRLDVVFTIVEEQWVNVLFACTMKSLVIVSREYTLEVG